MSQEPHLLITGASHLYIIKSSTLVSSQLHLNPIDLPRNKLSQYCHFSKKYFESWKWSGSFPQEVHPAANSLPKSSMHLLGLWPGMYSDNSSVTVKDTSKEFILLISIIFNVGSKYRVSFSSLRYLIWCTSRMMPL